MAYAVGDWMPRAVIRYFDQPFAVGVLVFLGCSIMTASIQYGAFGAVFRRLARGGPLVQPWIVAAGWATAELARTKGLPGNPWALIGYGQAASSGLAQVADLGGVYAVGFPVMAVNAALAMGWQAWRHGESPRRLLAPIASAGLAVVLVLAYGSVRIAQGVSPIDGATVPVVVVQGNLNLGTQWQPNFYGANLALYARLTTQSLARRHSALVVWPENALTFFLEREPAYLGYIAEMLARHDVELLTGGPRMVPEIAETTQPTYRNAAFVVTRSGEITARYEKKDLVPFAEYFPLPGFDLVRRRFGRVKEFVPGTEQAPLSTVAGRAGVLICNEAMFGENAIERVHAGAQWLAVLTNDGWGGEPRYADIALEMTRLRAVEVRRWMIRASTSGPSAIVDPYGRLTQRTDLETRGTIEGEIAPRDGLTVYARVGDLFAWGCAAIALLATLGAAAT